MNKDPWPVRYPAFFIFIAALLIVAWHLYLVAGLSRLTQDTKLSVAVNPISNCITLTVSQPSLTADKDNPFAAIGSAVLQAVIPSVAVSFEQAYNTLARQRYDVYAMLVPYRVHVVTAAELGPPATPTFQVDTPYEIRYQFAQQCRDANASKQGAELDEALEQCMKRHGYKWGGSEWVKIPLP